MAAGAWKIYSQAKRKIGNNTSGIRLDAGTFRMSLHRVSASDEILTLSTRKLWSSVTGEISARGGYVAGGRSLPGGSLWTTGVSAKQLKWSYTTGGIVFTASGSDLNNIKYACIKRSSAGGVTSGFVLCFATLSSSAFTISSPNTLTILPASTGVFTLA